MNDTVWSVNILLGIGLMGVAWVIYYTLTLDNNESKNTSDNNSSEVDK